MRYQQSLFVAILVLGCLLPIGQAQEATSVPEIDRLNDKGFSQLHTAASRGRVDSVQQLLEQGANIDVRHEKYQGTPLQFAASRGHADVVRLLLDKGAAVDLMDSSDRTALAWAVDKKQPECCELLLKAGADVFTKRKSDSVIYRLRKSSNSDLMAAFDKFFSNQSREQWLLWKIEQLTFTGELDDRQQQMRHASSPTVSIPADATPETLRGRLDVWLSDGIPKATSFFVVQRNGKLFRTFTLLREEKVEASIAGKNVWQPAKKMDFAWRKLPSSKAVATTIDDGEERLVEMMKLAQRFTMPGSTLQEDPVVRYENDLDLYKVPDGGVFVFLRGGLPVGMVCLEMRRGHTYEWFYAVVRQTSLPGAILLDGKPVYEWDNYWKEPRKPTDAFVQQPQEMAPVK